MKRNLLAVLFIVLLCFGHVYLLARADRERQALPIDEKYAAGLPGPLLKIAALEFDGLASDFYFLQSLVFIGSTFERTEVPRVKDHEWSWLERQLHLATDLDPYFLDPYYVANAHLVWDAQRITEANTLLRKGVYFRDWDWLVRFLLGFNYMYFLENYEMATKYFLEAKDLPDAAPIVKSMIGRLVYESDRVEFGIAYLESQLQVEENENLRIIYKARLKGLRAIKDLKVAVKEFERLYGHRPDRLGELVEVGILSEIPQDPYEGKFYLDQEGRIRTTSQLK